MVLALLWWGIAALFFLGASCILVRQHRKAIEREEARKALEESKTAQAIIDAWRGEV